MKILIGLYALSGFLFSISTIFVFIDNIGYMGLAKRMKVFLTINAIIFFPFSIILFILASLLALVALSFEWLSTEEK